jgi:sn-glycerol 3-phosphate transport system ATP-binding protein
MELAAEGPVSLRVELLERLGADTIVHDRLGTNGFVMRARVPGMIQPAIGDVLGFIIPSDRIHLFDSHSKRRLGNYVSAA